MSIPAFGVRKPVPTNLLMVAIIIAGVTAGLGLKRQFFPETDPDQAMVTLKYPGATPQEIEQTLAIKVEDKLADLDEVERITTTLAEGGGGIVVEFREGIGSLSKAVDEVERAIDALTDLPAESERIQVKEFEPVIPVIMLSVYGDLPEDVLKRSIRTIRDEIKTLPGMGDVQISGVRDYEISIDVRQEALQKHGLSLPAIAEVVRAWMAEVPGGTVRGVGGNIKVRTLGVAERADAIRQIVVRADADGRAVRLGEIAEVSDSFVDEQLFTRFNGQRAASLTVFKLGNQDIVRMAEMVRGYVDGRNGTAVVTTGLSDLFGSPRKVGYDLAIRSQSQLPAGARIAFNSDYARFVESRLELLTRNAFWGGLLVFATLLFFLNWRAATWVFIGLLTALCGTLVLMNAANITLNLLTMFGLIIVIGLLVDDGIVVAENIQKRHDRGEPALTSAVNGAEQVFWPVVATVMTTIVAFLPLTFIKGRIGDLLGALPMVVACALFMSLVESLLILPSHMGHTLAKRDRLKAKRVTGILHRFEKQRDHILFDRIVPAFAKLLALSLRFRYISLAATVGMLIISFGLVGGGRVVYSFLAKTDAETIIIDLRMPIGTSIEATNEMVARVEAAAKAEGETLSIFSVVGQRSNIDTGATDAFAPHVAQLFVELKPVEERDRESATIIASIRGRLEGKLDGLDRIRFSELSGGPGGSDITIEVRGDDAERMEAASREIRRKLADYAGVFDIADDNELGQRELQITLRPGAAALGFTTVEVARQVRGALFGIDAHVFAEQREDIDVRVRLDAATRQSLLAMEHIWLVDPAGRSVPLSEIADVRDGMTYSTIKRIDRKRTISIIADTAPDVSPETIVRTLPIDEWRRMFPMLDISLGGRQEREMEAFNSLPIGFAAAAVMIYVILAWLFSSYLQPLAVMLAIPFSLIGVIWGHLILGYEITFLSIIGFVALSGVVVNDSLILIEFYNHHRERGHEMVESLIEAGRQRLRPIMLTSLTTVLGLSPLILERSFQAKFLIPMAISISGGLISATIVVLLVLPCVIVIVDDVKAVAHYLWYGMTRAEAAKSDAAAR